MILTTPILSYRTIDIERDAEIVTHDHCDASIISYGSLRHYAGTQAYLRWLRQRIEEFPEGCVLAWQGEECVGHLEMEAPYGKPTGYIDLFYVREKFRGRGYGTLLHDYAVRYFRSWEAKRIELDVSITNMAAIRFYWKMGYRMTSASPENRAGSKWRMGMDIGGREGD